MHVMTLFLYQLQVWYMLSVYTSVCVCARARIEFYLLNLNNNLKALFSISMFFFSNYICYCNLVFCDDAFLVFGLTINCHDACYMIFPGSQSIIT